MGVPWNPHSVVLKNPPHTSTVCQFAKARDDTKLYTRVSQVCEGVGGVGMSVTIAILLCLMAACGAAEALACPSSTVRYHWIVCEISSVGKYMLVPQDGSYYLLDGSAGEYDCEAVEGMRLEVRCEGTDHILYRNGSSLGQRQVEWTFTVAEEVQGIYECRWPNGSLFGNRRVEVDGEGMCVFFVVMLVAQSLFLPLIPHTRWSIHRS